MCHILNYFITKKDFKTLYYRYIEFREIIQLVKHKSKSNLKAFNLIGRCFAKLL